MISFSLLVQLNSVESCHAQEDVIEHVTAESSMPCHSEAKNDHAEKKDQSQESPCSDCLSFCCHYSFYPEYVGYQAKGILSISYSRHWPSINSQPKNFILENFRPPIFS